MGGSAFRARALGVVLVVACSACSGGGSGGDDWVPGPDPPESSAQAARFLTQATFGPTVREIDRLSVIGYTAWLDEQSSATVSLQRPTMQAIAQQQSGDVYQHDRVMRWWRTAVEGHDQLRLRVAFAWSEIFVISDVSSALESDVIGMAEYYDILSRGALGNFRDLIEAVTLSPAMGKYLGTLRNRKADAVSNIRPDENYARELMQLFTIGLVELNADGTPRLDAGGAPIPTYGQAEVEELSRVLTGWNFANAQHWDWTPNESFQPMEPWEEYHDTGGKLIVGGTLIPPGGTAAADLDLALDAICAHPNVAPFICKQLIQRLVTSNPSPEYVARVAAVFADDGTGERGDLEAVVRALLLDDEARHGHLAAPDTFGKLREPLVCVTALWRAFDAHSNDGRFHYAWPEDDLGQAPLRSPSVFNFFRPDYAPQGEVANLGLVAPEMQIVTDTLVTSYTNRMWHATIASWAGAPWQSDEQVVLYLAREKALADDSQALLDHLDLLLMSGQMPSEMRDAIRTHIDTFDPQDRTGRVVDALYLIVTSPEFRVQK
jgi:uncharacterized protein (DUF1800 family)